MKIMNKLAALIATMAMCMTTVSTSVSAKTLYLSDEGDYNENLTEEIVTEEIPVEEEIPAEEEACPKKQFPLTKCRKKLLRMNRQFLRRKKP